jgi:ABC transport system ATP-binding/permease protein
LQEKRRNAAPIYRCGWAIDGLIGWVIAAKPLTIRGLMPIARLDKVSLSFGLRPLLDEVDLQIRRGERVCLLGRNGEGKSSLLRLITRQIVPDSGEVWVRPGARVASLAQEVSAASDTSVEDVIMSGFEGGTEGHADWQAELQANQVIARLELDRDAAMSSLSGGWRRRVMLGRALVAAPDLLLLDEPTNHLDIDAITWLEEMMLDFEGALLFISHDRTFVRRLATRIVELDRGQLRGWPGNYDDYVLQKSAALEVEAKHAALFDKKLAQEEVWIRKGVEARRTRNEGRVRALKQLRIDRSERRERIGQVEMRAQDAAPSGKLVFEATHVSMSFGGAAPVIADFSARIMRGDRVGIIGPNGCGKTTLIKLLVGELEPTAGEIRRGTSLLPAYFDQQREQLDESASIMDNVTGGSGDTVTIDGQPRHVSGYLRDFLFPPERLHAPVSMLSGGERNRLLLARLFSRPSNLLVMDEPTNDLDAETLDLLEEMVANYAGTLLLVSHDRAFLDNVVTSTLVFEGAGQVNEYVGGYSDWLRQRRAAAPAAPRAAAAQFNVPQSTASAALAAPSAARARRLSYKDQRELEAMPQKIQVLESEQLELQGQIADPALFKADPARAAAVLTRLQALSTEIENAYLRWDALEP